MSVRDAQLRISSREFAEWVEYYKLEPFGEERADYRAALIACTIANVWRGKRKRPFKLADFLLLPGKKPKQTWQEQRQLMKVITSIQDARVKAGLDKYDGRRR